MGLNTQAILDKFLSSTEKDLVERLLSKIVTHLKNKELPKIDAIAFSPYPLERNLNPELSEFQQLIKKFALSPDVITALLFTILSRIEKEVGEYKLSLLWGGSDALPFRNYSLLCFPYESKIPEQLCLTSYFMYHVLKKGTFYNEMAGEDCYVLTEREMALISGIPLMRFYANEEASFKGFKKYLADCMESVESSFLSFLSLDAIRACASASTSEGKATVNMFSLLRALRSMIYDFLLFFNVQRAANKIENFDLNALLAELYKISRNKILFFSFCSELPNDPRPLGTQINFSKFPIAPLLAVDQSLKFELQIASIVIGAVPDQLQAAFSMALKSPVSAAEGWLNKLAVLGSVSDLAVAGIIEQSALYYFQRDPSVKIKILTQGLAASYLEQFIFSLNITIHLLKKFPNAFKLHEDYLRFINTSMALALDTLASLNDINFYKRVYLKIFELSEAIAKQMQLLGSQKASTCYLALNISFIDAALRTLYIYLGTYEQLVNSKRDLEQEQERNRLSLQKTGIHQESQTDHQFEQKNVAPQENPPTEISNQELVELRKRLQELEGVVVENASLKKEITEIRQQIVDEKQKHQGAANGNARKITELNEKLEAAEGKIKALKEKLSGSIKENRVLAVNLRQATDSLARSEAAREESTVELQTLADQFAAKEAGVVSAQAASLAKMQEALEFSKRQLEGSQRLLGESRAEVERLQDVLASEREKKSRARTTLQGRIDLLESQALEKGKLLEDLTGRLAKAEEAAQKIGEEFIAAKTRGQSAEQQLAEVKRNYNALQDFSATRDQMLREVKQELQAVKQKLLWQAQQLFARDHQINQLQYRVDESQDRVNRLRQLLSEANRTIAQLRVELARLHNELTNRTIWGPFSPSSSFSTPSPSFLKTSRSLGEGDVDDLNIQGLFEEAQRDLVSFPQ